jgi:hypothetical protein
VTVRPYSSPEAFKQALEARLRTASKTGADFARRRQLLVFDRFLARVVAMLGDAATLNGGLARAQIQSLALCLCGRQGVRSRLVTFRRLYPLPALLLPRTLVGAVPVEFVAAPHAREPV